MNTPQQQENPLPEADWCGYVALSRIPGMEWRCIRLAHPDEPGRHYCHLTAQDAE